LVNTGGAIPSATTSFRSDMIVTLGIIGFLVVYFGCGVIGYGRMFAYYEHKYSILGLQNNQRDAYAAIPMGLIGLIIIFLETRKTKCGFKFTDGCTWVKE
jgi:hypothetical protein